MTRKSGYLAEPLGAPLQMRSTPTSGAATSFADGEPTPIQFGFIPWALRGLLLVPALQIVGVVATMRLSSRWREHPSSRPIFLRASGMHRFLRLYVPDLVWVALICGGFAGVWTFLRTGLILQALREPSSSQTLGGRLCAKLGVRRSG